MKATVTHLILGAAGGVLISNTNFRFSEEFGAAGIWVLQTGFCFGIVVACFASKSLGISMLAKVDARIERCVYYPMCGCISSCAEEEVPESTKAKVFALAGLCVVAGALIAFLCYVGITVFNS